jgi:hypothetical protein
LLIEYRLLVQVRRKIEIRITVCRGHAWLPVLVDFRPNSDIGDIERRYDFEPLEVRRT